MCDPVNRGLKVFRPSLLVSENKKQFLIDDLKTQAFFRYFIDLYIRNQISPDILEQIKKYQAENPGKIENAYIKVLLSGEQRKELAIRKITDKIKPQHFCRYFIEQYLDKKLIPATLESIKALSK